ncbi:H+/gluconate symporter [Dethiosulfatibacter aminovorans DSM 17477]|uniref:H+/gluconate symporter n=1 Tax=Dethiosulfatibacter aminovorans DSM 17477 TaxID=1121476 RepID=A0A1M6BXQ0_9FIRM|nr:GntP family permease [Dethiosulfatibacter aminovorans]SHI53565.1 H+/gluconate symporter [Dethiosulfatibacter aminovorans DSM 17477]
MLGVIGVLFSLALIMVIVYKGFGVIPASIICSLVVILTTGGEIWPMLSGGFLAGTTGFIAKYFFLLSTGAFLGQALGDSGSAKAIGNFLIDKLGADKVLLITTLTTAILSYGGVSLFVQTFTVIPLVLGIYKEANIPKRFMVGSFVLGNGTFAMTALPGLPSLPNLIPTTYLGTTPMAAPIMGIICAVFMFAAGQLYLARELKKCRERGEGFKINMATDEKFLAITDEKELPSAAKSFVPLIVVLVLIVAFSGQFEDKNFGVSIMLIIGALLTLALNWSNIPNKMNTMNEGFKVALIPLLNTAALVGFGTVVSQSSAFQTFVDFAMGLQFSPYISAALATNIVAGITGSASGGLAIFMKTLGQQYLDMGLNAEAFHRISAIACGGLDSLPHNGAVVTMFMLMGTTHKESYKYVFVIMCAIPLITTVLAIALGTIGII